MVYINKQNYLERKVNGTINQINLPSKKNWWFGKFGIIWLGRVNIPERLFGKQIRFKVEFE